MTFQYNGDSDIYLLELTDTRTGSFVTAATVSAVIQDTTGATISTVTLSALNAGGAVTIYNYPTDDVNTAYDGGCYRGQLLASAGLVRGQTYQLQVTATNSGATFYDEQSVPCVNTQT